MLFAILLISLILRIINLNQSLWLDEAINIVYAKNSDFFWFISNYTLGDFHPPGWFAILWIWGSVFGFSEISSRVPSVLLGIATVYITFLIGKKIFSKEIGLLAALFLSLAPLHIYYSQEARMYSLAAFATTLSFYGLFKIINKENTGPLFYGMSVSILLYSDYLAYFVLPLQVIWVLIYHRKFFVIFMKALFLGVIPLIPWLILFPQQLASGQSTASVITGWKDVVGGVSLKDVILLPVKILIGRISIENNYVYLLVVSFIGSPIILTFSKLVKNKYDNKVFLVILWFLIPPLLAFLVSFYIPIFAYFRFIFILPAFYLLVAYGLERFDVKIKKIIFFLIIFGEVFAAALYLFNPSFHREDWRNAVTLINQNSSVDSLTLHKNNVVPAPFQYYQNPHTISKVAFKKIPVRSENDFNNLDEILLNTNKIYLFDYLVDITDPQRILESKLLQLNFSKTKEHDFRGVGFVIIYERKI